MNATLQTILLCEAVVGGAFVLLTAGSWMLLSLIGVAQGIGGKGGKG